MPRAAKNSTQATYKSLIASAGIAGLSNEHAFMDIGELIDACTMPRHAPGITRALAWCDELEARGLTAVEQTQLEYFRSNAFDQRRRRGPTRHWEQPDLQIEILCLRRARVSPGFESAPVYLRCQILTNLGNLLSAAGREVEAVEIWSAALAIEPRFWMARGSRGSGLARYARAVYSDFHMSALFLCADGDLAGAIEDAESHPQFGFPEAQQAYESEKKWIDERIDLPLFMRHFRPDEGVAGRSKAERSYRNWCLRNHLFLNPINDAMELLAAADDSLPLPDLVAKIGAPPSLTGFFNQLKQEYVSGRWAYYSGTHADRPHFSDREVTLFNTLDYPAYGLAIEQVRTAYRVTYSLFDKIAFFLNEYFSLKIPLAQVSFGRVWKDKAGPNGVLAGRFANSKNHMLRGLYWLSKDLLDPSFKDVMAPDAQALSDIRNQLEHRYLKVHDILFGTPGPQQPKAGDMFVDIMAYSISRTDFEEKALRLLKLARAALIHLALAMHSEEQRRRRARRSNRPIVGQSLPVMEQSRKV